MKKNTKLELEQDAKQAVTETKQTTAEPAAPRYTGTVKWFSAEKCFGFIERPMSDGEKLPDIFVHFRGIRGQGWRNLKDGQVVEFEIVQGNKGPQAQDVVVLSEPEGAQVSTQIPSYQETLQEVLEEEMAA